MHGLGHFPERLLDPRPVSLSQGEPEMIHGLMIVVRFRSLLFPESSPVK